MKKYNKISMFEELQKSDDTINISKNELLNIIKDSFKHGYAQHDVVEAGLESYDPDGYALYKIRTLFKK